MPPASAPQPDPPEPDRPASVEDAADTAADGLPPSPLPAAKHWAAIHARPRAEKVVSEYLDRFEVPNFLPLRLSKRTYGARVRESWIPLFPGYLFYDHEALDRTRLFACRRIAKVLVPDDPELMARDLDQIARALAVEPTMRRCERLEPGTEVVVTAGALMGLEGRLVRHGRGASLVVQIHFTGFAAEVAIDEALVEPR